MKRTYSLALAAVSLAFLMGASGCEFLQNTRDNAAAPDASAKDKATAIVVDTGADLVTGLCPLGAALLSDLAASAGPVLAASVKAAASAACKGLDGIARPATVTLGGRPAFCTLQPVAASDTVSADEALAFNGILARRCG